MSQGSVGQRDGPLASSRKQTHFPFWLEVDANEELRHLTETLDLTEEEAKNLKEKLKIKDAWDLMELVKTKGESLC